MRPEARECQKVFEPAVVMSDDLFSPKERRGEQLNVRMSKRLKGQLEELARIWTEVARARSKDKELKVTMADVANRLLTVGVANAWIEAGGEVSGPEERQRAIGALLTKASTPPGSGETDN